MLRNANRIKSMVDEVMDLRKLDNNKMNLHLTDINAVDFIKDIVDMFRLTCEAKGVALEFNHAGYDSLHFYVDYNCFDKIMMNLLSNAVKYTQKGGKICIDLSTENGMVSIKVSDTGIGIPDRQKEKIFDRFYQASNHATGGTGIGLHITRALVMLHHGDIKVTDNPDADSGTVFTITLPTVPPEGIRLRCHSTRSRLKPLRNATLTTISPPTKTPNDRLAIRKNTSST